VAPNQFNSREFDENSAIFIVSYVNWCGNRDSIEWLLSGETETETETD
jgi:hypothetical protein